MHTFIEKKFESQNNENQANEIDLMSVNKHDITFLSDPLFFVSFSEPISAIVYSRGPGFFELTNERDVILST